MNIVGVSKQRGESKTETFVKWSIGLVQNQRISITKRSVNVIKEYRNYLWETDKNGVILNEPEHIFSHSMDAIRYGLISIIEKPKFKMPEASPVLKPYYENLGI